MCISTYLHIYTYYQLSPQVEIHVINTIGQSISIQQVMSLSILEAMSHLISHTISNMRGHQADVYQLHLIACCKILKQISLFLEKLLFNKGAQVEQQNICIYYFPNHPIEGVSFIVMTKIFFIILILFIFDLLR